MMAAAARQTTGPRPPAPVEKQMKILRLKMRPAKYWVYLSLQMMEHCEV